MGVIPGKDAGASRGQTTASTRRNVGNRYGKLDHGTEWRSGMASGRGRALVGAAERRDKPGGWLAASFLID